MKTLKTLLLSLFVLFIGTTVNAQDNPAQQEHAQEIIELQKQIEKLIKEQVQQQLKSGRSLSIQKKVQEKSEGGKKTVNSLSTGSITIIGPDGKTKTMTFNPENAGGLVTGGFSFNDLPSKPEFMIGISMDKIPEGFHELIGIEPGEGVIINAVMKGTPAEKAGLKKNDLILKLNGKKVTSPQQVQETIKLARGHKMKLGIRRGKENLEVELAPEKTKESKAEAGKVRGFNFSELTIDGEGLENVGFPISAAFQEQQLVGPGVIMKVGSKNKEMEALKQQVQELTRQQAEMKALLESVKELISEQK